MTPIVFWASWRPWPSAIAAAETVCAKRKPRCALEGLARRKIHMIAIITAKPAAKANTGESTIGMTTLSTILSQWTVTPAAIADPARPPISACDEDDGRPKYHVIMFHRISPHSPAPPNRSADFREKV